MAFQIYPTDCFNITCKGARHENENIPCQDYSLSIKTDGMTLAVVCDGHGAPQYFRSEIGARFAAEAVKECVQEMVDDEFIATFKAKAFTAYGPMRGCDVNKVEDLAYLTVCNLVLNILKCWDEKVKAHVAAHPLTDKEAQQIPEQLEDAFRKGRIFNFAYGTTLLTYVCTKEIWFAFQIGDGAIVSFDNDTVLFPVKEDDECHNNITTSLCDNDALDEVRVSYEGDGQFPDALFLCTDGLEKAFVSDEKLASYLDTIRNVLKLGGRDILLNKLTEVLPKISAISSGDDISLAGVYSS